MFKLVTPFQPKGDQPEAIKKLISGLKSGKKSQVLLGITGSGKTFTMANIIANRNVPTLILAHNKTLAAQLYQEFKQFFPENAVEYFVSYYDYYQPEAYIARTDTYIEKDLAINEKIDRMRLSATRSLIEKKDVIIISSVSCIYGLGLPEYYASMRLELFVGKEVRRDEVLLHLVHMQYKRSDMELVRGNFLSRGDVLEVMPAYEEEHAFRIQFFGDEVEKIVKIDPLTKKTLEIQNSLTIYPASHHVTPEGVRHVAIKSIKDELETRKEFFEKENKFIEKQRITERTSYDLEMIQEIGFCKGIENYSRHFSQRMPGDPPPCLLDYFPKDFLLFIDESHQTIPQLHAMHNGDKARKLSLVEFGFRMPSAYDNRPLKFEEFYQKINQAIYVSATPAAWEVQEAGGEVVEQVLRPTGLLDPIIEVRPLENQVDDSIREIQKNVSKGGRVLVTTLTKKLAEDLSKYLVEAGLKAKYLHSDIDTLERLQIINGLRRGEFDVLVGINLLREGLDLPEVTLVAILDADKEGFLRSETALIQTCGRAARNSEGRVIMYADVITKSIEKTLRITKERRAMQEAYNEKEGIVPTTVRREFLEGITSVFEEEKEKEEEMPIQSRKEMEERIIEATKEMKKCAKELNFEQAVALRDEIKKLEALLLLEEEL